MTELIESDLLAQVISLPYPCTYSWPCMNLASTDTAVVRKPSAEHNFPRAFSRAELNAMMDVKLEIVGKPLSR